jgi:hypothetical protein
MVKGLNEGSTRSMPRTTLSRMAMGKRRRRPKQTSMWVATQDLPRTAAHPFYARLKQILALLMRTLYGVGTPRGLQGRVAAVLGGLWSLVVHPEAIWTIVWARFRPSTSPIDLHRCPDRLGLRFPVVNVFTQGC